MSEDDVLHIICPPPRRAQPVIVCCLGALVIITGLGKNIQPILAGDMFVQLIVSLLMLGGLGKILHRNLFFRDQIYFLGAGATAPGPVLSIEASEVLSVRRRHASDEFSVESRMRWLHQDYGTIEIETSTNTLYFGVGLSEFAAESTITKIVDFCRAERDRSASCDADHLAQRGAIVTTRALGK